MNLIQHPDLLDRLAASHALGTLRGGARRRFEAMAREQAPVRAAALVWQARIGGLTELQDAQTPDPAVWKRIENLLHAQREQERLAAMKLNRPDAGRTVGEQPGGAWGRFWNGLWNGVPVWRGLSAAGALCTAMAVVLLVNTRDQWGAEVQSLQAQLNAVPELNYVAVLTDDTTGVSMLVTFDARARTLTLQREGGYREAADKSLQLWALPEGQKPRSLGVLGQDKLMQLTAAESDVRAVPVLAISLEPKGGVPSAGGPTGPVLFKGRLIQKLL